MLALDVVSGFAVLALWPGSVSTSADVAALAAQPEYLAVVFVLGTLTTAMGGAICARLAPTVPYWHAAAFGVLSIATGLLLSDAAQSAWFTALATLVTIPAAIYGAWAGLKARR
ncbi:hypothetical protein [Roseateles sp. P5_D6]